MTTAQAIADQLTRVQHDIAQLEQLIDKHDDQGVTVTKAERDRLKSLYEERGRLQKLSK